MWVFQPKTEGGLAAALLLTNSRSYLHHLVRLFNESEPSESKSLVNVGLFLDAQSIGPFAINVSSFGDPPVGLNGRSQRV